MRARTLGSAELAAKSSNAFTVVLCKLAEDPREVDLAVAGRAKAAGAIEPA
jgi:hypothetical protein